jgi:hypothetical protein
MFPALTLSGEKAAFGVEFRFSHTINLFHECENPYPPVSAIRGA